MYVTMDCDFLETDYFFLNQSKGQGGNPECDPLDWLLKLLVTVPSEPTSALEPAVSSEPSMVQPTDNPEVCTEQTETQLCTEQTETQFSTSSADEIIDEAPERYELPPQINRGIPPRRYDPEYEAQRSRYPIADLARGRLAKVAKVFNTVLYSV